MAGRWFLDGVDLSTFAWNVEARSAGWAMSARRGENRRVPGRAGSFYRDKVQDEGVYVLNMWAQGAELDGSMPVSGSEAQKVRDNLDALTRIFGSGGLHELARTMDAVTLFGRRNLLPNPSFEAANGKVVTRENVIANPSLEYGTGDIVYARRNFADNPSMEDGNRESVYRQNYARNPRMASEGQVTVVRTNLVPGPSFEAALAPWQVSGTNSAIGRRRYNSGTIWPPVDGGKWSLMIKSLASGNASAASGQFRVTVGAVYALQAEVINATGSARTFRLAIKWRSKTGTVLSTDTIDSGSISNGLTTVISGTKTAPASSHSATINLVNLSAAGAGETAYWDKVLCEQAAAYTNYFDGETDERDGLRHRWTDESGTSQSEEYVTASVGYTSAATNRRLALTTDTVRRGGKSLKVQMLAATALNDLVLAQTARRGMAFDPKQYTSAGAFIQLYPTITATRTVKAQLRCYDSTGTSLGLATVSVGGAAMTAVTVTLVAGEWVPVIIENVYTLPNTATAVVELLCGEAWANGDSFYADCFQGEQEKVLGTYFDGATETDDTFDYAWLEDPHDSISQQLGYRVAGWTIGVDTKHFRAMNGMFGEYSLRIEPPPTPTNLLPYVTTRPLRVRDGQVHTTSIYCKPNVTRVQQIGISWDNGDNWSVGTATSCTAGVWTRLSVIATAPATVDPENVLIRIGYEQGGTNYAVDGDQIDYDALLFEEADGLLTWFSGDSGKGYDWLDEPFRSISVAKYDRAIGWAPHGAGRPMLYREKGTASNGGYFGTVQALRAGQYGVTAGQDVVAVGTTYGFGVDVRLLGATRNIEVGITWYDKNGAVLSTASALTSCNSATWTRCAITGAAPANAVVGAPYILDSLTTASSAFSWDAAVFGFGATTTYADGNTASWRWTGTKNRSTSVNDAAAPSHWSSDGGTLARSSAVTLHRSFVGLWTSTGGAGQRILGLQNGEGSARSFRIKDRLKRVGFGVDVRTGGTTALKVQPALVPRNWNGWAWEYGVDPVVFGTLSATIPINTTQRVSMYDFPTGPSGTSSHYVPALYIFSSAGGNPTAGNILYVDSAMLTDYSSDTTYMDGSSAFIRWRGDADDSPSEVVGPARLLDCEIMDSIDFTSTGEELARFSVVVRAPDIYWHDPYAGTDTYVIGRAGSIVTVAGLAGNTAPIYDAVVTVAGPIPPFRLVDVGSGAWVSMENHLAVGETCTFDVGRWKVYDERGKSMISDMRKSDNAYLLPLTNEPDEAGPRIRVSADSIGRAATLTVKAKRKYHIA